MDTYESNCPACGQPIDYCSGHGELGDPVGHGILALHDEGDHRECHPLGCEEVIELEPTCSRCANVLTPDEQRTGICCHHTGVNA